MSLLLSGAALALSLAGAWLWYCRSRWLKQLATGKVQMRYCPNCRCKLKEREIGGKVKLACPRCPYVFWNNPLVVSIGVVPSPDGKGMLLIKRAIPPKIGMYALAGGFLEPREDPEQGVVREVWEESGLRVRVVRLLWMVGLPSANEILVFYECAVVGGELRKSEETSEVTYFPFDQLPKDIAFPTHEQAIQMYLKQRFGTEGGTAVS
jgi:ADP-ribose pyrophosphatase YjhB (NUDIX family)